MPVRGHIGYTPGFPTSMDVDLVPGINDAGNTPHGVACYWAIPSSSLAEFSSGTQGMPSGIYSWD